MSNEDELKMVEISEKTFIKLSIEKFLTFLIFFIVGVGSVYMYTTRQDIVDQKQNNRLNIVEERTSVLEKQLNDKLDQVLQNQIDLRKKQENDHEIVIRHEYENINKRGK